MPAYFPAQARGNVSPLQGVLMSPSPNQLPQPPNSNQSQTGEPIVRRPNPPPTPATPASAAPPATAKESGAIGAPPSPSPDAALRQQPIPPPSEPMQYRAIGLVRGKYAPSDEQFTRGALVVADGNPIDSVLLGRVMSLVKNHLDLETEHLWVVYPRTRQQDNSLHVQIVGVWEPEKLDKVPSPAADSTSEATNGTNQPDTSAIAPQVWPDVEDGYFSIRGEVIYQSPDQPQIIVKIRQAPRKDDDRPRFFKLTLKGVLEKKAVGHFWDFQVQRQGDDLAIQQAQDIGMLRPKKPMKPRQGGRPPGKRPPWKQERPSRPISKPTSDRPTPKPVKRQQQSGGESRT